MIRVSEMFSSIQGEGRWTGHRSIFLRLHGCNLMCGNPDFKNVSDITNQKEINAAQDKSAGWTCDTIAVWLKLWKTFTADELYEEWKKNGWLVEVEAGAHIVLTGGEPLMVQNDKHLILFLRMMKVKHNAYIEVETNGTFEPENEFDLYIDFYNCSPKLSNSANIREKRFNPDALDIIKSKDHCFKFVVFNEEDVKETFKEYGKWIKNNWKNVFLMPACSNREQLIEVSKVVGELARKWGVNFSPRLQLLIWNKATGV